MKLLQNFSPHFCNKIGQGQYHFGAGAQPALHFGVAIFMKFYLTTSSCLFNCGITFPQTVTDEVLFAAFPKINFSVLIMMQTDQWGQSKISSLIQHLFPYSTSAVMTLVGQTYRLLVNLPNFSSCFSKFIKSRCFSLRDPIRVPRISNGL